MTRRISDPDSVNLAFGTRTDLLTVIGMIESILGYPVERQHVEPRPGEVRHSQADGTRLLERFPALEPVALEVGLRNTIDWMRRRPLTSSRPASAAGWPKPGRVHRSAMPRRSASSE